MRLSPEQEKEAHDEIVPRVFDWYDSHKCQRPTVDEIEVITSRNMADPDVRAVFYRARRSQATTLELVTAILRLNEEIGRATPTVYVCTCPKERILEVALDANANVFSTQLSPRNNPIA